MINTDKSAYVVYVLMKVVLAVGSSILFAIVDLMVLLLLFVPLAILAFFGVLIGRLADWNLSAVLLLSAFALLALAAILFVMGFVYAPGLVFFQSYAVEFFGARYEPLRSRLSSAQPAAPLAASPPRAPIPPWPSEPFPT